MRAPHLQVGAAPDYPCLMPLRIAIVGSFSTGKTTLAEVLAGNLDLPLLPETAREVVELGFKLDKDATQRPKPSSSSSSTTTRSRPPSSWAIDL